MTKSKISSVAGVSGFSRPLSFRLFNGAGITAAIGLAALPAFLTLSPLTSSGTNNVHAETTETLGTSASITSTLGLSANSISMSISPSSGGAVFKTGKTIATVSTNNETGYTLYFSDGDGDNALNHANLSTASITSTVSTLAGTNMLPNTWGYTLGESVAEGENETDNTTNLALTYSPIPTDRTIIRTRSNNTPGEGESTAITFGVKVDVGIPSGTYSDQVAITAIPNYNSSAYPESNLWLNSEGTRISTLQEMTPDVCASVPIPAITATGSNVPEIKLTDTRDGNEYKVRKLADGNCWMVESLKIAGEDEDHPRTLTSADSNVTTDFELPAATATSSTAESTTVAYIANNGANGTYLYNFYAATAGSGGSLTSGNAPQDICPKGWHLPNGEGNGSWQKLLGIGQGVYEVATSDNRYNDSIVSWGNYNKMKTSTENPVGLQLTGMFYGHSLEYPWAGDYWSRAVSSGENAYYLSCDGSNIYTQHNHYKRHGRAIRCVANETTPANATYMQEVNACPGSLPEGTQYTLKDKRDNKEYTVARINHSDSDSLCWMTKNLAIGGDEEMVLDSSTTNLPSGTTYTLPASSTSGFSDDAAENVYVDGTYGGYYSYPAATAGENPSSGEASKSICPKGWRLPTKAEFNALKSYKDWSNSSGWTSGIFKGQLAGYYRNGSPDLQGSYGDYWSSTANSSDKAYDLNYNSSSAYMNGDNKRDGYSVRCVFGS